MRLRLVWTTLFLLGCGSSSTGNVGTRLSVAPSPLSQRCPEGTAAKQSPDQSLPATYLALFEDLARRIEAHHVFAEGPKVRWPANRARLRSEFERVATREEALVALAHLQASLGDRHCRLSPPTGLRRRWLGLGFSVFVESTGGRSVVRVEEVLDPSLKASRERLAPGDEIVAVDGQPIERWLLEHPFESNSLNEVVAADEQAGAVVFARLPWSAIKEGDARNLRLRRGGVERDERFTFASTDRWEGDKDATFDDAPAMSSIGCRADKYAPYTNFVLAAVGTNVCVYRPKAPAGAVRASTRVARFVSFDYGGSPDALRAAKADHDLLTRELAGASAVVLDLHENHGGNNPFVFLSWFARKSWDHQTVSVHVSKEFSDSDRREFLWGDSALVARYQKAIDEGRTEESWPFLCTKNGHTVTSGTCESEGPRPSELVTKAPVAVITGPECTSSCDSFVSNWSTFAMGPLVGQQPAHGYTTIRHEYPLTGPDGRDLGVFRIALSSEGYPRSGKPLEGAPVRLDWEAPRTFETRHSWIDLAVNEAARALTRSGSMR